MSKIPFPEGPEQAQQRSRTRYLRLNISDVGAGRRMRETEGSAAQHRQVADAGLRVRTLDELLQDHVPAAEPGV